jgi:gluconate 2-dehydrogenase gamma chain
MGSKRKTFDRRSFLGMGLAAGGAGTLASCARTNGPSWRFFTAEEARTVDAICEQIIPADRDAGARDAAVVRYIDLQLTRHLKRNQQAYREGLATVDSVSRQRFGRPFAELSPGEQADALADVEKTARPFFDMILAHTMQGFYGDPRHGGNRGSVSWKMLGLPFPPVRGRVRFDLKKG